VTKISRFDSKGGKTFAIADLTPAYSNRAEKVERGIAMLDRRAVLVQDEITAAKPAEIWWLFHTPAEIEISTNGLQAVLTRHGRHLTATIAAPASARFETLPAEPLPGSPNPAGQAPNQGIRVLAIHLKDQTEVRLAVEWAAETDAGASPAEVKPLADW